MTDGDQNLLHHTGARPRRSTSDSHERAVLHAEIERLVRALSPYRVLRRTALKQASRAESWHEVGFDLALQAAIEDGKIEKLPLGFFRLPHPDSGRPC